MNETENAEFCNEQFKPLLTSFTMAQQESCLTKPTYIANYCNTHFTSANETVTEIARQCLSPDFLDRKIPEKTLEFCWDLANYLNELCVGSDCGKTSESLIGKCYELNKPPRYSDEVVKTAGDNRKVATLFGLLAIAALGGSLYYMWKKADPKRIHLPIATLLYVFYLVADMSITLILLQTGNDAGAKLSKLGYENQEYGMNSQDAKAHEDEMEAILYAMHMSLPLYLGAAYGFITTKYPEVCMACSKTHEETNRGNNERVVEQIQNPGTALRMI